jgi:hypothetical protein
MRSPRAKDERNTAKFNDIRLTSRLGAAVSSSAIIRSHHPVLKVGMSAYKIK